LKEVHKVTCKNSNSNLPALALSVRQPWAWAIIHGGKDIENRSWQAVNRGLAQRGRIAIHASKGMTRDEYEDAREFMLDRCNVTCPPAAELIRGGIIGSVEVVDVVLESESPWVIGRPARGLVLRDPQAVGTVIPALGALGYFRWQRDDRPGVLEAPAKWMLPKPVKVAAPMPVADVQRDFSEIWGVATTPAENSRLGAKFEAWRASRVAPAQRGVGKWRASQTKFQGASRVAAAHLKCK
jgi:hypothetical protein